MPLNSFSSVSVVVGCASGWGASLSVVGSNSFSEM